MNYNTLVVLVGVGLLGASAGLIGCFAVLRGRALVGDTLAHAALPGLCLAFLILERRSLPVLLTGALASGLAGLGVLTVLRRWTRIKEDAALGTVLSVFFGAGIVLSGIIQRRVTEGSKAGLDSYILGKTAGMILSDVYLIAGLALVALLLVLLMYKEFQLISFDNGFARAQGWPVLRLDLLLTGGVAVLVVIGLPAVGAVLVAALLILPAASARFWTERLGATLILSAGFGLGTGLIGTALSASASGLPAGPVIVLSGTVLFLISALFGPGRGLLARALARRRFRLAVEASVLLTQCAQWQTREGVVSIPDLQARHTWRHGALTRALRRAQRRGEVTSLTVDRFRLTPHGQTQAQDALERRERWMAFLEAFPDLADQISPFDADAPFEEVRSDLRRV